MVGLFSPLVDGAHLCFYKLSAPLGKRFHTHDSLVMKSLQELKLSPYKENNAWTGCRNLIQCRKIKHLLQEQLFLGLVLFLKDTCTAAIHWCNLATLSRATSELIEVENLTYATKVD